MLLMTLSLARVIAGVSAVSSACCEDVRVKWTCLRYFRVVYCGVSCPLVSVCASRTVTCEPRVGGEERYGSVGRVGIICETSTHPGGSRRGRKEGGWETVAVGSCVSVSGSVVSGKGCRAGMV